MPNGGSDCCGTCWFNRANGGQQGSHNHDHCIASHCEIRGLDISDPFYTYCANHPHHRPERDPIPIGPVFTGDSFGNRKEWQPSPDSEEIRQNLLRLVSVWGEPNGGYIFFTAPALMHAIHQLINWGDSRLFDALATYRESLETDEDRAQADENAERIREDFESARAEREKNA